MNILPINTISFGKLHISHDENNAIALKNVIKSTEGYIAMKETFEHIDKTSGSKNVYLESKAGYTGFKSNKNLYTTFSIKDNEGNILSTVDIPRKTTFRFVAEKFRNLRQDYDKKMEISTNNDWLREFDDLIQKY